jgi:GT2 family glycosyltransferase
LNTTKPAIPDISVIVVSFNTREVLRTCLTRLMEDAAGLKAEVIVVDNASKDGSADMVAGSFPQFQLVRSDTNLGFAAANNVGFLRATGRYLVLLNPDAFLEKGALARAVARMDAEPRTGLAGGRLVDRHGALQPSGRLFPSLFNELLVLSGLAARFPGSRLCGRFDRTWADPSKDARVDWVPGAFNIIRREAIEKVGNFDERFFLYYEEVDLCRRISEAGYEIWYWPEILVTHLGGESSKTVKSEDFSSSGSQLTLWRMRSGLLYYRKHEGALGAWLASRLEMGWNRLRLLRSGTAVRRDGLLREVSLMQRAWSETRGGTVSPQRPW